jgi:hypothetical protein
MHKCIYISVFMCMQRRGTARALPNFCLFYVFFCVFLVFFVVLCIVCFVSFSALFVCICVLYFCHRVATQLQLNMSYHVCVCVDSIWSY